MKKENLEKIKCLESYDVEDPYKGEINCKCTLSTYDGGKSWTIGNVFYVSAKSEKGKFIEEADLQGLSLITE